MTHQAPLLTADHLEQVAAWGEASRSLSYVFRPSTAEGVANVFTLARQTEQTLALRGGGNSYGDAFSNAEGIVLDTTRLTRILAWNPETGILCAEPGVTIEQLWQYVLGDGWWPPIVTGTAKTTLGGCAAMNTHGKNGWRKGTFGDHTLEFELLLPTGEVKTCSRTTNNDLFHAAIGGAGLLGVFLSLTLQMTRVYSGLLEVEAVARPHMAAMLADLAEHQDTADYIVDCGDGGNYSESPQWIELADGTVILMPPGAWYESQQTWTYETDLDGIAAASVEDTTGAGQPVTLSDRGDDIDAAVEAHNAGVRAIYDELKIELPDELNGDTARACGCDTATPKAGFALAGLFGALLLRRRR